MGGNSSKQKTNGKSKLEIIEDEVNDIVNDILINDGIGGYKFNNRYEDFRNLTNEDNCKKYAAYVESTMAEEFNSFPIYNKEKKLGEVTLIPFEGDKDKQINGTKSDGTIIFKGSEFTKEMTCKSIAKFYMQLLNLIETIILLIGIDKEGNTFCETRMKSLFMPSSDNPN